ncbi:MAG: hypothetical protein ACRD2I_17275 [Vicinamibacterales bacterium]
MTRSAGTWFRSLALVTLATVPLAAQTPPPSPTTAVLASLTIKPDADRSQLPKVMPSEVRETVKLYLDGKIQQWYARGDGRGVIFILNVSSVADAKALMESLPLAKANIATFEYTPLTPLTPLRLLVAEPAASARGNRER